jgi:two-component system, response regulator PdtaR
MQILVVEDDVMLADCLAEALMDAGHLVCGVVSTVAEAVALARLHRPDVALLDMQMRGRERGSDIADQLAESGDLGHTGILYVTGESGRVHQEARVGHACLDKPYSIAALNSALQIVRDIALEGSTSHPMPRGLQLLCNATRRVQPAACSQPA